MKLVYVQDYEDGQSIACWYGKPPKGQFIHDTIRLKLGSKDDIYITPDEAATMIRALSSGLAHFLTSDKSVKHIIKAKHD